MSLGRLGLLEPDVRKVKLPFEFGDVFCEETLGDCENLVPITLNLPEILWGIPTALHHTSPKDCCSQTQLSPGKQNPPTTTPSRLWNCTCLAFLLELGMIVRVRGRRAGCGQN